MNTPAMGMIWYWGSSLVLAALLYRPVGKLIWVLSVRRLERKLGRSSEEAERERLRGRSRVIAGFVAVVFALLFTRILLSPG